MHRRPQMPLIPDQAGWRGGSTVDFRVTEDMVQKFAALTGDQSALHVSESFARRSAYRRPVVHGMLPVGFIALSDSLRIEGLRCIPVSISGRFAAPVYAEDRLQLLVELTRPLPEQGMASFSYTIRKGDSAEIVTHGDIAARYRQGDRKRADAASGGARMPLDTLQMRDMQLENIAVGQSDEFRFRIVDETLREFASLLADGSGRAPGPGAGAQDGFCLPNLLSTLLYSTSVGVLSPGASATFLEFSSEGDCEVELGVTYCLRTEVAHVSRSTRIVKKKVTICRSDEGERPLVQGRATALVNQPPRTMPSIQELKATALDLGLKDKVVLVTGASRGIGETTAKLFGLLGARVAVNYHRGADDAARVAREICAEGGQAAAFPADVSSPEAVGALVRKIVDRFGTIDVLVNNAARDYRPIPFLELTWNEVQKDLDVIAKGAFLCCQHVVPLMIAQGGGKIINISTVAADNPPMDQTKYVMAKSALVGMTRSLSAEFASRNIQVNLVVPNFVETDLVAHVPEGFRRKIAMDTPMQRLGSPVDVAQAVVFLASSFSSFTTGQKIMVTGGGAPYL